MGATIYRLALQPCDQALRALEEGPTVHLGFKIHNGCAIHVVRTPLGFRRLCSRDCIVRHIVEHHHLVSLPRFRNGLVHIDVLAGDKEMRSIVSRYRDRVVYWKKIDARRYFLTEGERRVLELFQESGVSAISRRLGVSKQYVHKVLRKAIGKALESI